LASDLETWVAGQQAGHFILGRLHVDSSLLILTTRCSADKRYSVFPEFILDVIPLDQLAARCGATMAHGNAEAGSKRPHHLFQPRTLS
jgi:hypothetical protein